AGHRARDRRGASAPTANLRDCHGQSDALFHSQHHLVPTGAPLMHTTSTARTGVRGATLADRLPVAKLSSDGGTRHVRGSRAAPETARPSVGGVPAVIRRPGGGRVIGAR